MPLTLGATSAAISQPLPSNSRPVTGSVAISSRNQHTKTPSQNHNQPSLQQLQPHELFATSVTPLYFSLEENMFRTTAQIRHVSAIPAGIPASRGVEMLHDHEFFIKCDPHMIKFEALQTPQDPAPAPPPGGQPVVASPKCYAITDRVHALPAGLWDSDVVSNAEFFNLERGVFIRMRGPMGMVLETVWQIEEVEDGRCEIVEDVVIACSRLLVGVVKGSCEDGWKGVHGKMVERLKGSS